MPNSLNYDIIAIQQIDIAFIQLLFFIFHFVPQTLNQNVLKLNDAQLST